MIDLKFKYRRDHQQVIIRIKRFTARGLDAIKKIAEKALEEGLLKEQKKWASDLLNDRFKFHRLAASTKERKKDLAARNLMFKSHVNTPLVRFKQIYQNISVQKTGPGQFVFTVKDVPYIDKESKKASRRTVADIVRIHAAGNANLPKRELFRSVDILEMRGRLIAHIGNRLRENLLKEFRK